MFTNLQSLSFGPSSNCYQRFSFDMPFPTVTSSNLLELHILVHDFKDLLYLLDGRFNQLHTLKGICKTRYHPQSPKTTPKIDADSTGR